jgi:hypothetical protein
MTIHGSDVIRSISGDRPGFDDPPEGVHAMKCPKCEGYMCVERFSDYYVTFYASRCVNCGAIVDPTILLNKSNPCEAFPAMSTEQS